MTEKDLRKMFTEDVRVKRGGKKDRRMTTPQSLDIEKMPVKKERQLSARIHHKSADTDLAELSKKKNHSSLTNRDSIQTERMKSQSNSDLAL